jgi:hypothetical protein
MVPHRHKTVPFLPPTLPSVATFLPRSCRFCHLYRETSRSRKRQTGLNSGIEGDGMTDTLPKSGKNGNVDWDGQHCRWDAPWPDTLDS